MIKLIADSGSTKTDWRLILADDNVKSFKTGGFNPYFQNTDAIAKEIEQYLLPELLDNRHPEQIFFYGAGCANEDKCNIVKKALRACFPDVSVIEVVTDMLGAARALCGTKAGIAAILGTGANSCYYDGSKIITQSSSLGFILGDEGSGAYLGKALIRGYLYNELPSDINNAFKEDFQLTKDVAIENIYRKPFPNRYLASFVPFIKTHIEHGYMQNLVYYAFDAFFEHHVCKYPDYKKAPFYATGAVAFYFEDLLKKAATNRDIQTANILESPIDGMLEYHQG